MLAVDVGRSRTDWFGRPDKCPAPINLMEKSAPPLGRFAQENIRQENIRTINSGFGGARRSRTADLLNAIQALSQLSYGPIRDQ